MAQFDARQYLRAAEAAPFIFGVPEGSVVVIGGIDGAALRELIDHAENIPKDRRALFVRLQTARSVNAYVEQIVEALANAALRLWPVWFGQVSFAMCHDDALGRQAAGVIAREAARCPASTPRGRRGQPASHWQGAHRASPAHCLRSN
jgi:hypothetical protein